MLFLFNIAGFAQAVAATERYARVADTNSELGAATNPRFSMSLEQVSRRIAAASAATQIEQKALLAAPTRQAVVDLYNNVYLPGNTMPTMSWTGSVASCNPGTTSVTYRQSFIDRVNVFRTLARLPSVTLYADAGNKDEQTQAAALLMSANNALSHSPPAGWNCYGQAFAGSTVGAHGSAGANSSNLALSGSNVFATNAVIDAYMTDSGAGNKSVGHRRGILDPAQTKMAVGAVPASGGSPAANALWWIDFATRTGELATPQGVSWPPAGFIPFQLLPSGSNRWSFHYPHANFSGASISITTSSATFPVTQFDFRSGLPEGDPNGEPSCPTGFTCIPEDAVVFRPPLDPTGANGVSYTSPGAIDKTYTVAITGITGPAGVPSSVSYTVTVIDPAVSPNVAISGNATQSPSGNVDGAAICASPSAGVSCGSVNAGAYSCTVPNGWTGSLHLQAGNTKRAAARQFTTAVTSAQVNQHFVATDANNATLTCNLDIDNNGLLEEEFDGAMILRKLFGFTGNDQAVADSGVCAQRTSVADKATFLSAQNFDVNDNGALGAKASLDGLVLVRLMLGVPGATAVTGTDLDWASVQSEINTKCGTNF